MSVTFISNYDLTIPARQAAAIKLDNIKSTLSLDGLGDLVTDNQILIKQIKETCRVLTFKILKSSVSLFEQQLKIVDVLSSPSSRYWRLDLDGVLYQICKGTRGVFQGKWTLEKNGGIIAYTEEDTTTDPWDATWASDSSEYDEYTNIICSKTSIPIWGVIPISDVVGEIGTGTGVTGEVKWLVV